MFTSLQVKRLFLILPCVLLLSGQDEGIAGFSGFDDPDNGAEAEDQAGGGIDFFATVPKAPKELEITNEGDAEYKVGSEELIYRKNVVIKGDTGIQLFADEAIINLTEEKVTSIGNVSVYNGPFLYRGEKAVFYYVKKKLDASSLRTGVDPFLLEASQLKSVERDGKKVLVAENARVTTDDYKDPSYWITADQFSLYPDDVAVFRNMKVRIGGVPVFWLPYMAQSLDKDLGYHFTPGGQTNLGFFWKNRFGMHLGGEKDYETGKVNNPDYLMQLHVDPYTRRGVGLGVGLEDLDYKKDQELGIYSLYWIHDLSPETQRTRIARTGLVDSNRYFLEGRDRRDLVSFWDGELRLDSKLAWLSDRFFLEDYDENRYRYDPQPDNNISLTHTTENIVTSLTARFQLNNFYETDERLPEFTLDRIRSPLFGSSILYESQSSVGYLRESLAQAEITSLSNEALTAAPTRLSEITNILEESGYFRAHTWHEFSRPIKTSFGLHLIPRLGAGYTFYHDEDVGISDGRMLSFAGIDASLKLHKTYEGVSNERLGLDGLHHIVQPYASLSMLDASRLKDGLSVVDRLTPITRPRPINVGRYSAIDVLDDWSQLRMGIRQTFLTKRNERQHDWLYWDSYIDFLLGEKGAVNSFSNLYNELKWHPLPWLTLNLEAQSPITDSANNFTEIFSSANFMLGKATEVTVGYGLLKNHPIVTDSNQLYYSAYRRLNEEWGAGLQHRWQFDDNTLEMQSYSLHKNMKSWIFSGEVFRRDFRVDQEWGFTLGFTLRDFPEFSLPVAFRR